MEKILVEGSTWKLIDKARAKRNDGRMVLEGVYLSDKYLAATNGRILITVDRDLIGAKTITAGAYNVIAVGKQDKAGYKEIILEANEQEYPDIEKVIPKQTKTKSIYHYAPTITLKACKSPGPLLRYLSVLVARFRSNG